MTSVFDRVHVLRCRFSDVSLLPADGGEQPVHKTSLGISSSAANLTDGVYENQLIPNFQRVTICGEDASEVCTAYSVFNAGHFLSVWC